MVNGDHGDDHVLNFQFCALPRGVARPGPLGHSPRLRARTLLMRLRHGLIEAYERELSEHEACGRASEAERQKKAPK
jgi:hypothetical protein